MITPIKIPVGKTVLIVDGTKVLSAQPNTVSPNQVWSKHTVLVFDSPEDAASHVLTNQLKADAKRVFRNPVWKPLMGLGVAPQATKDGRWPIPGVEIVPDDDVADMIPEPEASK